MAATDLVLAMTGASGAPYGVRLLEVLLRAGRTVHLTISPAAVEVMQLELDRTVKLDRFNLADLLGEGGRLAPRVGTDSRSESATLGNDPQSQSAPPGRVVYHH